MTCKKCGHVIDGKSPVCINCGAPIPDSCITEETKKRMRAETPDNSASNTSISIKAFGAFLCIIGIIADVISLFLISSSSYGAFNTVTIVGTIAFLIGIALVANG